MKYRLIFNTGFVYSQTKPPQKCACYT